MTSHQNTLKIQVPVQRPVPPNAARIGEFFARFLAKAGQALSRATQVAAPSAIRAELLESADRVESQRPAAALSLRSVAAKGWVY